MHEDLERLDQLDRLDRERARLERKIARKKASVKEAEAALTVRQAAVATAEEAVAGNRTEQLGHQRKLSEYQNNRGSAERLLETGQGDPEAAERQVVRCDALIDDVETVLLELLEAQDELEATRDAAEQARVKADGLLDFLRGTVPGEVEERETRIAAIEVERGQIWPLLPKHIAKRYDDFLVREKWAVARIVDGACDGCRVDVPAQQRADLHRGVIEACRRCHRWLIPSEGVSA